MTFTEEQIEDHRKWVVDWVIAILEITPDERYRWWERAECRGLAVDEGCYDTFFPRETPTGKTTTTYVPPEASARCRRCDVQACCLEHAIAYVRADCVAAGMTKGQREQVRRAIRRLRAIEADEEALEETA